MGTRDGAERVRLRDTDLEWRVIDGEVLALDTRQWRYMLVTHSGVVLWEALKEGKTREELALELAKAQRIEAARAERDVDAFLAQLDASELLVTEPAA